MATTTTYSKQLKFVGYVMLISRSSRSICGSCQRQLLNLFTNGHCTALQSIQPPRNGLFTNTRLPQSQRIRSIHATRQIWEGTPTTEILPEDGPNLENTRSVTEMEAIVRQARQTFGETLPADFLSSEEYNIYERLYGPPLRETLPEDVDLLKEEDLDEDFDEDIETPHPTLFRENQEGSLEEVEYRDDSMLDADDEIKRHEADLAAKREDGARPQNRLHRDIAAATSSRSLEENDSRGEEDPLESLENDPHEQDDGQNNQNEEFDDYYGDEGTAMRTHPLTIAGRFDTSPATLHLDRETFVDPVASLLATASNKQLTEVALRTFGGPGLPNSTATPSSKHRHLQQQPIALQATQNKMKAMEANAFLAAIMPGTYAAVMSTLVETRKRLGSEWLLNLMKKPGGPRVLDVGAGGAGILAWREILRAEWDSIHDDGVPQDEPPPLGKSTVVTGSEELRRRASSLLEDTTFFFQLPSYLAAPKQKYDVIIAPYTLWTLGEDRLRNIHVKNFWSLLNPNGGVLILIEKGVPRGFELIAGAREMLLKNHISSPTSVQVENELENPTKDRFTEKEPGMIIAPCTNHAQCPMYTIRGQSKGRKDHCHFSQRYIRPPYLQHILGAKERNHEDIRFSYIVIQRGKDKRKTHAIEQGDAATESAFEGHDPAAFATPEDSDSIPLPDPTSDPSQPLMFALPRAILPPLKRRNHIILDFCTPSGTLERWTVPRSFGKQAYHDARKSQWGDLWALGAKHRIKRTARIGAGKEDKKGKKARKVVDVRREEEEEEEEGEGLRGKAKGKGGKRERKDEKKLRRMGKLKEKEL